MAPKKAAKDDSEIKTVTITVEEFMRSRDAIIGSFEKLKSAIEVVLQTYRQYTANILKTGGMEVEFDLNFPNMLFNPVSAPVGMNSLTPVPEPPKKRAKREKKPREPDQPKRPQTAFLLFSATARKQIKEELGENADGKNVEEEILKRYKALTPEEMESWKHQYQMNRIAFEKEMREWRTSKGIPNPPEKPDAHNHEAELAVEAPTADAVGGAATSTETSDDESPLDSDSGSDSEEEEPETPAPPKEPTPPPEKPKGKGSKATKASKKAAQENGTSLSPEVVRGSRNSAEALRSSPRNEKSPEKRKKGEKEPSDEEPKKKKSKVAKAESPAVEPEAAPSHEKKKDKRKRKSHGS